MNDNFVLVTGGCGYIGSHMVVELLTSGRSVVIIDNFSNCSDKVPQRIKEVVGAKGVSVSGFSVEAADIRDAAQLDSIFRRYNISSVVHFAGLKAVAESHRVPVSYYDNNVVGTIELCKAMQRAGVKKLIFSSSATVYGYNNVSPYTEVMPVGITTNPYGTSKQMVERILMDHAVADSSWSIAILRYFNPIGAHRSGMIGEHPAGEPANLLPYLCQVASGAREILKIYGNDYDTHDGTGVRDYIHVLDLVKGHLRALQKLERQSTHLTSNCNVWNLGTGTGYSVLDIVKTFELVTGIKVPYSFEQRRAGDVGSCWACTEKSASELDWVPEFSVYDMIKDAWNWQVKNPRGYE